MIQLICFHCGERSAHNAIERTSECPHCERDAKACVNCKFYEENHHHQCREPQAEWVRDKEKSNFCEYFLSIETKKNPKKTDDSLSALEKLFSAKKPS